MKKKLLPLSLAAVLAVIPLAGCGNSGSGSSVPENSTEPKSTAGENNSEASDNAQEGYQFVLMNIPYADFYQEELEGNDQEVDAVSSATNTKWNNPEMFPGTYNNGNTDESKEGQILGVQFPVYAKADDLAQFTKDNANEDYSYTVLTEEPSYYKTMTVADGTVSFSEIQGDTQVQTLSEAQLALSTDTPWGDYQLSVENTGDVLFNEEDRKTATIYGAVLEVSDKQSGETISYGLRHLENIWLGSELAWSCGIKTKEAKGNPLRSDHYASMMGKVITGVTYYTEQGIYYISAGEDGLYVPYKFENTFEVAAAPVAGGTADVTMSGFPEDYEPEYAVTGADGEALEGFSCDGAKLTWGEGVQIGAYTLTVTDASGKYASYAAEFELQTEDMPAQYDSEKMALVAAEGASEDAYAAYIANVKSVAVGEQSYNASGRRSMVIVKEDGTLDLTVEAFAELKSGDTCELTVNAVGYSTPLTFTVTMP